MPPELASNITFNWNMSNMTQNVNKSNTDMDYSKLQSVIQILVGIICGVGITGNGLNFYLMIQRTSKSGIRRERGVYIGFACLALSDILFCIFTIPRMFISANKAVFNTYSFSLVYQQFGDACLDVFVLCSTWITVYLGISRTLIVCDPLRKRGAFCMKGRWTLAISILTLCASFIFDIPAFMTFEHTYFNFEHKSGYLLMSRSFVQGPIMTVHNWFRFVFGYVVPFLIMLVCNICLVVTLRKSDKARASLTASTGSSKRRVSNRITPTLVAIILAYLILMTPSEILDFIFDALQIQHKASVYKVVRPFANLLQTTNFAINFALHIGINTVCRKAVRDLICFSRCQKNSKRPSLQGKSSFPLTSVTGAQPCSTYIDNRHSLINRNIDMS